MSAFLHSDVPHTDVEWAGLKCDVCGSGNVTLCAGTCHHYCDDHGPDDEGEETP